jgi:hypothetical protein
VIGQLPKAEVLVAVVASVAVPEITEVLSPFTKPVMVSEKVGFAAPKTRNALFALTIKFAGVAPR